MGKMKIGIYCYLIADISTKVLQKCSFSLLNIFVQTSKFERVNFRKEIKNPTPIREIKLKLCRNVQSINCYKRVAFIVILFLCNFMFPQTYNGEIEKWHLLLFHCRYFDKTFYRNVS